MTDFSFGMTADSDDGSVQESGQVGEGMHIQRYASGLDSNQLVGCRAQIAVRTQVGDHS